MGPVRVKYRVLVSGKRQEISAFVAASDHCELVIDNSMKIVNCKLVIASAGGMG
jgi:hypothetical protein